MPLFWQNLIILGILLLYPVLPTSWLFYTQNTTSLASIAHVSVADVSLSPSLVLSGYLVTRSLISQPLKMSLLMKVIGSIKKKRLII